MVQDKAVASEKNLGGYYGVNYVFLAKKELFQEQISDSGDLNLNTPGYRLGLRIILFCDSQKWVGLEVIKECAKYD